MPSVRLLGKATTVRTVSCFATGSISDPKAGQILINQLKLHFAYNSFDWSTSKTNFLERYQLTLYASLFNIINKPSN